MNQLEEIISAMEEGERKEFRYFIQRNKRLTSRKDLAVFDRYAKQRKPLSRADILELGFPTSNAYHSTRKRLYAHLSDYAILRSQREDTTKESRVNGLISIAKHLFGRGLHKLAWSLLDKAMVLAEKNGLYAELNTLYMLKAEHAQTRDDIDVRELSRLHEENRQRLRSEESLLLKRAELTQRITQARRAGKEIDLVGIFQSIVRSPDFRSRITDSPRSLFLILRTIRESVVYMKEYQTFASMATSLYEGLGTQSQPYFSAEILYMIAHAEYRNKRFRRAEEHLTSLTHKLAHCSKTDQNRILPRIHLLRAANGLFVGRLEESKKLLLDILTHPLDPRMKANVTVNLSTYYFFSEDYGEALKCISTLSHTDKWYEERMGLEWCFKQRLIELLIIKEKGDTDLFESRLRSLERRFSSLLKREQYKKAKAFVRLIKRHERLPDLKSSELEAEIEISWEWLPKEQEDLQAMMFYSWLKSKIVGKKCYAVMVEMVGQG